jgi:ketosteroid isomerase-like protein
MTREQACEFAQHWIAAWNAHDLEAIMSHYNDGVELMSPLAVRLLGVATGRVVGKAQLRAYFQRGLDARPDLHFELKDVLWGMSSLVIYFTDYSGTNVAEFMETSADGKVTRVVANRNA